MTYFFTKSLLSAKFKGSVEIFEKTLVQGEVQVFTFLGEGFPPRTGIIFLAECWQITGYFIFQFCLIYYCNCLTYTTSLVRVTLTTSKGLDLSVPGFGSIFSGTR